MKATVFNIKDANVAIPITKEEFGGKAASLRRLIDAGFNVPPAVVIPCKHTFDRPDLSAVFSNKYVEGAAEERLYAVRSGAPISMPGLLETKLNVKMDGVIPAINAVWDSWNTEHAIAYRESKGIDHNIGTAVIVQRQVTNIWAAGVAFTAKPDEPFSKYTFNPVIEYLEGVTGEALVGGTQTPKVATKDHEVYKLLEKHLKQIHEKWGPSDVEWVISNDVNTWDNKRMVYFVQQRELKFSKAVSYIAEAADIAPEDIIYKAKPVGAPVRRHLRFTKDPKKAKGRTLIVENFASELYKPMMEAGAILSLHGGATCHASIIAREMNKPAISDIPKLLVQELLDSDGVYIIDGGSGVIARTTKPEDTVETMASNDIKLDPSRLPDFSLIAQASSGVRKDDNRFAANTLLIRLYGTLDAHSKGLVSDERKAAVIKETARIVSLYIYNAVICEARHTKNQADSNHKALVYELGSLGVYLPTEGGNLDREKFQILIPQPKTLLNAISVVKNVMTNFYELSWSSSFGGKKWGLIAETLLAYLRNEISDLMFLDSAFNLQHNNGCVFGKFGWFMVDTNVPSGVLPNLQKLLDIKQTGDFGELAAKHKNVVDVESMLVNYPEQVEQPKETKKYTPKLESTFKKEEPPKVNKTVPETEQKGKPVTSVQKKPIPTTKKEREASVPKTEVKNLYVIAVERPANSAKTEGKEAKKAA